MYEYQSGLFLLKERFFSYDNHLNVRHIFEKTGSFLKDYKLGDKYVSQLLPSWCAQRNVDTRVVLSLIQVSSGLLSRESAPDNKDIINYCLGLQAKHALVPGQSASGLDKQVKLCVSLLQKFYSEGADNYKVPILVSGKEIHALNKATYAICSVLWLMGYGFTEMIRFRKVYRQLFQTPEVKNDRPANVKAAPRDTGFQNTPRYSDPRP